MPTATGAEGDATASRAFDASSPVFAALEPPLAPAAAAAGGIVEGFALSFWIAFTEGAAVAAAAASFLVAFTVVAAAASGGDAAKAAREVEAGSIVGGSAVTFRRFAVGALAVASPGRRKSKPSFWGGATSISCLSSEIVVFLS